MTDSTALAMVEDEALAALNEIGFGDGDEDGIGQVGASDVQFPSLVFNASVTDKDGEPISKKVFFNTLHETTQKTVRCVLLQRRTTNRWTYYDEEKNETQVVCASEDQKHGVLRIALDSTGEEGTVRGCQGCPQAQWATTNRGKKTRECSEVDNVIAVDLDTKEPFVIRFKRTAMPPWKTYLRKHHIGRRIVDGRRVHMPLWAYECTISLEMASTIHSVPVFERSRVLAPEELVEMKQLSQDAREYMDAALLATEDGAAPAPAHHIDGRDFVAAS